MSAIPAVAVLPAMAAVPALAATETPVMALFREWEAAHAYALLTEDDDEFDARCAIRTEIEQRMFEESAPNERDVCLKVVALTLWGNDWSNDGYDSGGKIAREAAALIAA